MKQLVLLIMAFLPLCLQAQEETATPSFVFAVYSQQQVLDAMPAYRSVMDTLATLKAQYEAEAQRMANEFNNKYEEFIEVQRTLVPTILNKRQAELQELAERGESFKHEAQQQLQQAEQEALQPIMQRLTEAIQRLGAERGYAFVLNTDHLTMPFIHPNQGEDITEQLQKELGK